MYSAAQASAPPRQIMIYAIIRHSEFFICLIIGTNAEYTDKKKQAHRSLPLRIIPGKSARARQSQGLICILSSGNDRT